jgi:hypothetical protein
MCIHDKTFYKGCGCTVSEIYERCGYHDDMFSECIKYSEFREVSPQEGRCGTRFCKNPAAAPEVKLDSKSYVLP